jgi:DNA-binding transcriptional LysR family regulator
MQMQRTKYAPEFKDEAVKQVVVRGHSVVDVAKRLGTMVAEFLARYPDMAIDVQLNDRKVDIIDEGFDLALRIGALADSSLVARQLASVDILACAAPAYVQRHGQPAGLSDLQHHQVLQYAYLTDPSEAAGAQAPLISNSGELLAQAACAGAGVVLTPRYMVQQALDAGEPIDLFALPAQRQLALYALYPHRTMVPLKLRVFVDFLAEQFAKKPL